LEDKENKLIQNSIDGEQTARELIDDTVKPIELAPKYFMLILYAFTLGLGSF
jgi:hypothetical protein